MVDSIATSLLAKGERKRNDNKKKVRKYKQTKATTKGTKEERNEGM